MQNILLFPKAFNSLLLSYSICLLTEHIQVEDGMKVMFCPGFKVPLIMIKSDGGFTYDTSDVATIHQRLFDEKGTWLIYVTDAGQVSFSKLFFL